MADLAAMSPHRFAVWILLLSILVVVGISDAARGGSRGGTRSSSSYRSSTYRSSTYRAPSTYRSTSYTYRSTSYTYRSNSYTYRSTSNTYRSYTYRPNLYRSYIPVTRYNRYYYGYSGYYYYYYNMYYYYYRGSAVYLTSGSNRESSTICENYGANANGTTLGAFYCPMPFEPSDFTSCCGDQYLQYCCKKSKLSAGAIAGIVIGSIIGIILIILIIYCSVKACNKSAKRVQPGGPTVTTVHTNQAVAMTATSGQPAYYKQPYGQQPAYPANPNYNNQPAQNFPNPAYNNPGAGYPPPPPSYTAGMNGPPPPAYNDPAYPPTTNTNMPAPGP